MINLNDSTPAAPMGGRNVKFQQDSAGNVSAYTGLASAKNTVAPVAGVVTIDCSLGNSFLITVTAAITSITLNNPNDGQIITLLFQQDITGHAVAASALKGSWSVTTSASKSSCYQWTYNVGDTSWYQIGANNM